MATNPADLYAIGMAWMNDPEVEFRASDGSYHCVAEFSDITLTSLHEARHIGSADIVPGVPWRAMEALTCLELQRMGTNQWDRTAHQFLQATQKAQE